MSFGKVIDWSWVGGNVLEKYSRDYIKIISWHFKQILSMVHSNHFYAPEIKDRGAYCFCPVCHSVLFSETLTLLISFEQWVLELWCFTWVFLVIRPSRGYHFFYPVTLTLEFDLLFENFNLAYNFWTVTARALIFHMNIPCDWVFL